VWAIEKCSYYLKGSPAFTVITDHKPLVGTFSKPLLELDNTRRLQRFREKIMEYNFEVTWAEGKSHLIADALSRAPVSAGLISRW